MPKRFVYFYLMNKELVRIRSVVPAHVEYWKELNLKGYQGGPFSDRSGGLITFEGTSADEIRTIVRNDPFNLEDLIEEKWTKEWMAD